MVKKLLIGFAFISLCTSTAALAQDEYKLEFSPYPGFTLSEGVETNGLTNGFNLDQVALEKFAVGFNSSEQDSSTESSGIGSDKETESQENHGHGTHSEHRHHIAGLVAATTNLDGNHTDFTLGGDYQYRLSPRLGVGGFGEVIFAEHTERLLGISLYFYPVESLWLRTGSGVVFVKESSEEHEEHSSATDQPTTTESKFLFRFGAGYNFEMGGLTITPSLDLDLVCNSRALVWGLGIGKSF